MTVRTLPLKIQGLPESYLSITHYPPNHDGSKELVNEQKAVS
jgi:hypothetical protein